MFINSKVVAQGNVTQICNLSPLSLISYLVLVKSSFLFLCSVGAKRVKGLCVTFKECCDSQNFEG